MNLVAHPPSSFFDKVGVCAFLMSRQMCCSSVNFTWAGQKIPGNRHPKFWLSMVFFSLEFSPLYFKGVQFLKKIANFTFFCSDLNLNIPFQPLAILKIKN